MRKITSNPRVEIANLLCQALDQAHLPWSITHGAEGYPDRVGRDFDILLPASFHAEAVKLIEQAAEAHGWNSCLVPLHWAGAPVLLWKLDDKALHFFEMHFISRIDWAGCILADGNEASSDAVRTGGLSIAIWPAFAKRVLSQILAGCWHRIVERPNDFVIQPNESEHLEEPMTHLFGSKAGIQLLELIRNRNLIEIKQRAYSYRARLILRALLPGTGVRLSVPWLTGKFARTFGIAPWRPPFLVLVCPAEFDASGLLSEVVTNLGFAKCRILPPSRPASLLYRLRERWQIHIHRSLFRLVAVACTQNPETQPDTKPPCVHGFPDHEVIITSLQRTADGTFRLWFGNSSLAIPHEELGLIAAQIANRYLMDLSHRGHILDANQ